MAEKQNKSGGQFTEPVFLLVLDKQSNEQYLTDSKFGVVDWQINGKSYKRLEKRETKQTDKGPRTKTKGLTLKDLDVLKANWSKVRQAMGSRLPEDQDAPGGGTAAERPAASRPVASGPVQQDF